AFAQQCDLPPFPSGGHLERRRRAGQSKRIDLDVANHAPRVEIGVPKRRAMTRPRALARRASQGRGRQTQSSRSERVELRGELRQLAALEQHDEIRAQAPRERADELRARGSAIRARRIENAWAGRGALE